MYNKTAFKSLGCLIITFSLNLLYLPIRKKTTYLFFLLSLASIWAKAQCPQFYDSNGNLSSNPYWISCNGNSYTLTLQSPTNFNYTAIHWGDGNSSLGGSYISPATITHTYTVTVDTFVVKIVTTSGCTVQGVVVMEKPVNAGISIPTLSPLTSCAPKVLQFINSSTNVSQTTHFIWNFGDGTGNQTFNYLNAGDTVSHLYNRGTVNCQTSLQLSAYNYCTYGVLTVDNYSPIKIYDRDQALIACPVKSCCFPDNSFTFKDSTIRNCLSSGNVNPRFEKWDFGNNFGTGHDSIINWQAWPPTFPVSVAYPAVGSYTVTLYDSSLCGIDTAHVVVNIVNKPFSSVTVLTNTVCQNLPIIFTNGSTISEGYNWNFDAGAGWQTLPYGNETKIYTTAGNYTVSLVTFVPGSNAYCSDTFNLPITVKPNPVSNFSFSPSYGCNNSSVSFTDLSTGIISGYNWDFNNGNTSNAITPPVQSFTTVGVYTISLVTTSTSGCQDTKDTTFHVYPAPIANFSVNTSCTGYQTHFTNLSTPTVAITSYTWNYGDGTTQTSPSYSNTTHSYTNSNTYTVMLKVKTAYCSDSATVSLLINQTPTATYTASNYTVCPNTAISFSNTSIAASTYSWTFGSLGVSDSTNPIQIYTNSTQTVTTYPTKLVAISAQGCKDSITQIITVNPKPVAQYITSYAPSCAPVLITFTNTTIGGNTYLWGFGDGTNFNHFDTTHLYIDTTTTVKTFSVSMITVNTHSCSDTSYSSYIVYPQAIYNFVPKIDSGCAPLLASFHTDSGAVSYLWSFGDGSLSAGSFNQAHTFIDVSTVNDTFKVALYATNAYSCKDTSYGTVIVKPSPTSQFSASPASGCTPLTISFSNTSTTGTSNQWYFGDGTTSTAVIPNHTYIDTGSTVKNVPVSLVVTSANGCKDSTTTDVTLYPAANYSFTVNKDTGCSIFDVFFTTDTNSTILASYSWNFGDGTSLTGNNPTHHYSTDSLSGQTFTVTMIATSQYGCKDSMSKTIFVYPKPTASFSLTNNPSGCAPLVTTFTNTSIGALSSEWYFGDSTTSVSNLTNPLPHSYQNTGNAPQNYNVSLVVTGAHGCKDSTSRIINVNPVPLFSYQILPDSGCSPLPVNCILVPANFSPSSSTYNWHFGDSTTSTSPNPSHTYINGTNATINYTVSLTATNSYGCSNMVDSTVTVFSVPAPIFSVGPLIQTYPAATVNFINLSPMGLTYNWNLGDSTLSNNYAVPPHTYTTWGNYPIKLVVNNGHCSDSIIQNITIKPPIPVAGFTGSGTGCQPLSVTFTNTSVYATSYLWDFGDGNIGNDTAKIVTHIYNTAGVFTVTLMAYGNGNSDTLIRPSIVTVYQKPFAYFTANPLLVYVPTNPTYFTNQSQNAVSYAWDFGDGSISSETTPQHTYLLSGVYPVILIATSINNCTDTFTLPGGINALTATNIQIPNAFTPNPNGASGGGVFDPTALNNFIFHPVLTGIVQYDFSIYNKWGELLFETTDQKVGWDGYYNGKLCEQDTYIYKISALGSLNHKPYKKQAM